MKFTFSKNGSTLKTHGSAILNPTSMKSSSLESGGTYHFSVGQVLTFEIFSVFRPKGTIDFEQKYLF